MKISTLLIGASALAVSAIAAPASAAIVTIDFSGHGTGGAIGSTYAAQGVTFNGGASFSQCSGGCPAPTPNGFFAYAFGESFGATFASAQSSISFQGVSNSNTIAQGYNAAGMLVGTAISTEAFPLSGLTTTLSGIGITRVEFGGAAPAFTNLSYDFAAAGVPEPATWAMMIGGFGVVGGALRRRRQGTTRVSYAA